MLLTKAHVGLPPLPDVQTFRRVSKAKGMELASQRRHYRDSSTTDSEAASSLLSRPALTARGMLTGLKEAHAGALSLNPKPVLLLGLSACPKP